jgi:hypothetical protein
MTHQSHQSAPSIGNHQMTAIVEGHVDQGNGDAAYGSGGNSGSGTRPSLRAGCGAIVYRRARIESVRR